MVGLGEAVSPFIDAASIGFSKYSWVLWVFVPLAGIIFSIVIWKLLDKKKKQWTHTLIIKRVLENNFLSKPATIKMRRFPLIREAEVFELEKPLLGSYLISELDTYSGTNEYSIILSKNNRVYTNTGEKFNPEKNSVDVSGRHAEIDLAFGDFKAKYQQINKTQERVEWSKIAKFAMLGLLIIAVMVVSIKGIDRWAENHKADAAKAAAETEYIKELNKGLELTLGIANTESYILDKIKEIEGTNNVQGIIRRSNNETV